MKSSAITNCTPPFLESAQLPGSAAEPHPRATAPGASTARSWSSRLHHGRRYSRVGTAVGRKGAPLRLAPFNKAVTSEHPAAKVRSMTTPAPRDRLAALLGEGGSLDAFSPKRTAPVDDLRIEVPGVGAITMPVSDTVAEHLRQVEVANTLEVEARIRCGRIDKRAAGTERISIRVGWLSTQGPSTARPKWCRWSQYCPTLPRRSEQTRMRSNDLGRNQTSRLQFHDRRFCQPHIPTRPPQPRGPARRPHPNAPCSGRGNRRDRSGRLQPALLGGQLRNEFGDGPAVVSQSQVETKGEPARRPRPVVDDRRLLTVRH